MSSEADPIVTSNGFLIEHAPAIHYKCLIPERTEKPWKFLIVTPPCHQDDGLPFFNRLSKVRLEFHLAVVKYLPCFGNRNGIMSGNFHPFTQ